MKNSVNSERSAKEFFGRSGKMGLYTTAVSVVLLAVLIVVNLIVSKLPTKNTKLDTSPNKLYTLSDTTTGFLSGLKEDVTLWYVCPNGGTDSQLETFLERYAATSAKLSLSIADPVMDPEFLGRFGIEDISDYSIIVESGKRFRTVDYNDLYYYYNEQIGQLSAAEYSSFMQYYGSYASIYPFTQYFDGDNRITSAVEYVTAEKVPTVYLLEGHDEEAFNETVSLNLFTYAAIDTKTVNLSLAESEIPDDADVVIINNPGKDLSDGEAEKLTAFFDAGGKLLLITSPGCDLYPNLAKLTSYFGMSAGSGTVTEGDSSHAYPRNAQYIYPDVNDEADALSVFAQYGSISLIIPATHPIILSEKEGIVQESLLTTSQKAYTTDRENPSEFTVAASASAGEGRFVWIGSAQFLSASFINATNGGNYYFLYSAFSWMQSRYTSSLPTISAVDMSVPQLTVSEDGANFVGTILIIIIPLAVLAGGLVYWLRRRKR